MCEWYPFLQRRHRERCANVEVSEVVVSHVAREVSFSSMLCSGSMSYGIPLLLLDERVTAEVVANR